MFVFVTDISQRATVYGLVVFALCDGVCVCDGMYVMVCV